MNDSATENSPRPSLLYRLYRVAGAIALGGIIVYLVYSVYAGRESLQTLEPVWDLPTVLLAVLAAGLAFQSLFAAWVLMLRRSGYYRRSSLPAYARIWWTSYMYRYLPGKVLVVVERARLGVNLGIPAAPGAAMPVVETLLSVMAGSTVALLAVTYYTSDPCR